MREPAAGDVLGSYRIVGKLSVGGMGTIYQARHELLDRPAAVKVLHPHLTTDGELVERFFREAKLTTSIRHPGIVEVYDFGYTDEGEAYLVMEYLEGMPLGQRALERGRFSEVEAATIARGIASALRAAHEKGIVHRDLKPDNVFLVADLDSPIGERVKVLDFGIAKLDHRGPAERARFTQTGVLMGTPLYMAPEQARAAGAADHRADLYSLGCILYELLVGHPVFQAEGAGEVLVHHMFTQPTPPAALRPDLSPELEDLILRLLHKEPHARPASAHEVVNALTEILSGRPAAKTIERPAAVHAVPAKRRSSLPIVAAALTAAITAAVVAVVVLQRTSDEPTSPPPPPPPPATVEPAPPRMREEKPAVVETPQQPGRESGSHRETRITPVPTPVPQKPRAGSGSATVPKPRGAVTDNQSPYSDKI
ncbi:MAG: serine/threonine protein kinase [Deltaproteobacteria bacterium]|nr:serine/threonine protein kinase [Deltaproteobacteria bacterium]